MTDLLTTAWRGSDLIVSRLDREVDRIACAQIRRAIVVHEGAGDSPGDLEFALLETEADYLLLPASTGIGGRILFERQAWWEAQAAIYWVPQSRAPLSRGWRSGWLLGRSRSRYARVPAAELAPLVAQWPLEGPQTWDQRKWQRIARNRALAPIVGPRAGFK